MEEYGLSCPSLHPTQHSLSSLHRNLYVQGQEAEGLLAKGLFLGSPYELWDGMGTLISSPCPPPAPGCYLSKCSQQREVNGLPMAQDAENPIQVDLVLTETSWKSGRGQGAKAWLPHCPPLA